jgi:ketosteroid isomerase-like protein
MAQENIEVVRRVQEAFEAGIEAGDFGAVWDTGLVADNAEFVSTVAASAWSERATYRGRAEWSAFMRVWTEDFQDWTARIERLIDAPPDRVVAFLRQSAVGKGSGVPVNLSYGLVFELDQGRICRLTLYLERQQALEAAGLSS